MSLQLSGKHFTSDPLRGRCDAAFWMWQYQMHAYWLLEEVDGYDFGLWGMNGRHR